MQHLTGKTMILLVGEQPAPNLLPVRQLQAGCVVLVYSDRTQKVATKLRSVMDCEIVLCHVHAYDIPAIVASLREIIAQNEWSHTDLVFNLTGGTKMMMLAAYLLAQELGSPWIYLNSEGNLTPELLCFAPGDLTSASLPVSVMVELEDYLRMYMGTYGQRKIKDAFEIAISQAIAPEFWPEGLDEFLLGVCPKDAGNVDVDAVMRAGTQFGVVEIKNRKSLNDEGNKFAIDQLTTAASQVGLGTYVRKIVITTEPLDVNNRKLATKERIDVIELPGFRQTSTLSAEETAHLREEISRIMGIRRGARP